MGSGVFETAPKPKQVVFKSAGFVQGISDSKVVASTTPASQKAKQSPVASTSQTAKYHCTFCQKDGHVVEFCYRRAKIARKDRVRDLSRIQGRP